MSIRFASLIMSAAAIVLPGAAYARPVYLICSYVEQPGGPETLEITADEANGTVSYVVPRNGSSNSVKAAFTGSKVEFSDHFLMDWTISRTNLTIEASRRGVGTAIGKCRLNQPPKRAF